MLEREPSRTALAAASYRAAHQVLEGGRVFRDPLAVPILAGFLTEAQSAQARSPESAGIRFFVTARSRIAEDELCRGVETRGVRQVVVLGAGLDTFAYRNPWAGRVRVFEVDHPATLAWKRRRLHEADIGVPEDVCFTPVDFERDDLAERLDAAGLRRDERCFFLWLGVVPYLTADAIAVTLSFIGGHAGGAELVFDYGERRDSMGAEWRAEHDARAARVAAAGEPFLTFFDPAELASLLGRAGFCRVTDLDVPGMIHRIFGDVADRARHARSGGHLAIAATA